MPLSRRPAPQLPVLVVPLLFAAASCSPRPPAPSSVLAGGGTLDCPAPIGEVPREDCAAIADDFGAFSLGGALKIAGKERGAEVRIEAIRAATALSTSLTEQRVALCESYNSCKVRPAEHAAKDELLAGSMRSLIDLWKKRNFSRTEEVVRFRESVRAIEQRLSGSAGNVKVSAPKTLPAAEALAPSRGLG